MNKLALAAAVTGVLGALSIASAAADGPRGHHHHYVRGPTAAGGNPAVTDGFVMNGAFDWRHRRYGLEPAMVCVRVQSKLFSLDASRLSLCVRS
jgi:hypothetical protein